jgi:hypothetical protein
MPLVRAFLDWSRPALPAVGEYLVERYGGGGVVDLSGVVVVLTGRRASRRLTEILVEQAGGRLIPPQTITEGEFPELLYEPKRPFAGRLVQHFAWAEAVRRMPRPQAEQVLREVPDDGDVDGWMALGELLWRLHRELAAELLDFSDVLAAGEKVSGFTERRRWEALRIAQQEYLALLDGLELWDRQTARLVAVRENECHTDRDIVLVGTVDLNRSTRAMVDQVSERVTALIHAPASLAERFDEYGCLRPEAWMSAPIELSRDQVHVVDKPVEQADVVVRVLSGLDGRYRADEITVGVADESLVPQLQRRLAEYGVPSRWIVGRTLPQTAVMRLLSAVAEYLETDRADHFATLVRHPDVAAWLCAQGIAEEWIQELDCYLQTHLQQHLGFWLGPPGRCGQVRRAFELVTGLLAEFREARALPEWSPIVRAFLVTLGSERTYDPEQPAEKMELNAIGTLCSVLDSYGEIPIELTPVVSGAQALRLTLEQLVGEAVPPPPEEDAVEVLGWLELPLDDAPVLVLTSFNEDYVPSSVRTDLFLPNRFRQRLGLLDNDRRYARDAYALSAILTSRERAVLVAGRRDSRGDPRMPSRLFFACDAAEAAQRVRMFFREKSPPALPAITRVRTEDVLRRLSVRKPPPLAAPIDAVSVTAFASYIACPYRFYLRHVLKLEAVEHERDEMDSGMFGSLLHDVLREFGRSELREATSPDEIGEFLMTALDEQVNRQFGSRRMPAVSVQIEQLRRRLVAFSQWQANRAAEGWTIAFVEAPQSSTQVPFPVDRGRTIGLRGRIDRIDRHRQTGQWALLDYKSGDSYKEPENDHRQKGEWSNLQLPLYRHLAAQLGVSGEIALGYITVPKDTGEIEARIADWTAEDLSSADRKARDVAAGILDGCFWPPRYPPPQYADDLAAICQDNVSERRLVE